MLRRSQAGPGEIGRGARRLEPVPLPLEGVRRQLDSPGVQRREERRPVDLVPGDVMLLEAGDRVPADARVTVSSSMRCDEAPLTGESLPVEKASGDEIVGGCTNDNPIEIFQTDE